MPLELWAVATWTPTAYKTMALLGSFPKLGASILPTCGVHPKGPDDFRALKISCI